MLAFSQARELEVKGLLAFILGESRCALPVSEIQEVLPVAALSPIPGQTLPVEGMLNLRGAMIPVLDLRSCLGLPQVRWNSETRIIVIKTGDARVGVVVDRVEDVVEVEDRGDSTPLRESHPLVASVKTFGGRALTVIRPERLAQSYQQSTALRSDR